MIESEYCICGEMLFFNNLSHKEIMECHKCKAKHVCIEQYYQGEDDYYKFKKDFRK